MNPRYTIAEIADRLNTGKEIARGLIRFLVAEGLAENKGERKNGRGRAEIVYSFVSDYEKTLASKLKEGKLT